MNKITVFNVDTLAAKAGVSRRTIHYYLQRGLLMPPEGGGRGSHYTQAHLDRIRELQQLSDQGVPLSKIKEYFEKGTPDIEEHTVILNDSMMARPLDIGSETWNRHEIIDGVELHIRADAMTEEGKRKFLNEVRKLL